MIGTSDMASCDHRAILAPGPYKVNGGENRKVVRTLLNTSSMSWRGATICCFIEISWQAATIWNFVRPLHVIGHWHVFSGQRTQYEVLRLDDLANCCFIEILWY